MTPNETRAYKRGYAAGRKRVEQDREAERRSAEVKAWNRCYLALLPAAMLADGWRIGGACVNTSAERIKLAQLWADTAAKSMRITT
jgi:hypothetical protein